MTHSVPVNFNIANVLLRWASEGGATNRLAHVHYMGVSYSRQDANRTLKLYTINLELVQRIGHKEPTVASLCVLTWIPEVLFVGGMGYLLSQLMSMVTNVMSGWGLRRLTHSDMNIRFFYQITMFVNYIIFICEEQSLSPHLSHLKSVSFIA